MAKRDTPGTIGVTGKRSKFSAAVNIEDVVSKSQSNQTGPDLYSNYVQVVMTTNEMLLDFYQIAPIPGKDVSLKSVHLQRVFIPLNLVKGLASAIQDTADMYEKDNGITLINSRKPETETELTE